MNLAKLKYLLMLAALLPAASEATYDTNSVWFDLNSSNIREDSRATLHEMALIITRHPTMALKISGSACLSEQDSESLWFERAVAVRTFLIQHGVNPRQMTAVNKLEEPSRSQESGPEASKICHEDLRLVRIAAQ